MVAKPRPQPTEPEHKNALTVFYQTVRRRDSRAPRHKLVGVLVRCQQLWIVLSLKPPFTHAPPGGESLAFPSSQVGQSPGRGSSGGRGLNAELPRFGPAPFRALRQPVKNMRWWIWRLKRCGEQAGMPTGPRHAASGGGGLRSKCMHSVAILGSSLSHGLHSCFPTPLSTSRSSWWCALRTVVSKVSLEPQAGESFQSSHGWKQCLHLGV